MKVNCFLGGKWGRGGKKCILVVLCRVWSVSIYLLRGLCGGVLGKINGMGWGFLLCLK